MVVDILVSRLALYTNLPGGRCLIHVGREGRRDVARSSTRRRGLLSGNGGIAVLYHHEFARMVVL
jgi:hypothetical protein